MPHPDTDTSPDTEIHPVSERIPAVQDEGHRHPRMASDGEFGELRRYFCKYHRFETRDAEEAEWHEQQSHPLWCHHGVAPSCTEIAAYTYFDGMYGRPLCAEHAAAYWDDAEIFRERVQRVIRPANHGAELLEASHPVEEVLREETTSVEA